MRRIILYCACIIGFVSCTNEEPFLENSNSDNSNNYTIQFTTIENKIDSELKIIEDAYSQKLDEEFGTFNRYGAAEDCDKAVVLACKDAEFGLNDFKFSGSYTIEAIRTESTHKEVLYAKTYSTQEGKEQIMQKLSWEQGRYTTTGAKAASTTVIRTTNAIIVNKGEKYSFETAENTTTLGFYYDKNGKLVTDCVTIKGEVTIPSGVQYMHISYRSKNNIDVSFASTFKMYQVVQSGVYNLGMEKMLTIIDDDSHIRYYTDIYPIAKSKKASISSAVIAGQIDGRTTRMTWDNINESYCAGMEMLCHTYSHPLTTDPGWSTYDEAYFEEDYRKAKNILKTHGINVNLLVFSGSSARYEMAQEACKRASFDGGFLAGDNKITYGNTDRYKIPRFRIGNDSDYHYDINILKGLVDKLSSQSGWMVWMVHTSSSSGWVSGTDYGSSAYMLGQIIDYARANNIKIVTAEYGFRKCYMENLN